MGKVKMPKYKIDITTIQGLHLQKISEAKQMMENYFKSLSGYNRVWIKWSPQSDTCSMALLGE